jgi:LysM repeat protein
MMSEEQLILALEDCIHRLSQGQSIDQCLRDYPEYAEQLKTLLEMGQLARKAEVSGAQVLESQARVYQRFEAALHNPIRPIRRPFRRIFSLVAATFLTVVLLIAGTALAAQESLPGDSLYGIKRASENLQLFFSGNDQNLHEEFNQRRIDETQELLALARSSDIRFEGLITENSDTLIIVADFRLELTENSQIETNLQINQRVLVDASLQADGRIFVNSIRLVNQADRISNPAITITPSNTISPTEILPSPTASPQQSREATVQRPSFTPSPTQIRPLTLTPSATNTIVRPTPTLPPCIVRIPSAWGAYRVQSGDNLFSLALDRGTNLDEVLRVNCIDNPNLIAVGQVIYLPQQAQIDSTSSPSSIPDTRPSNTPSRDTDQNTKDEPTATEEPARD